MNKKSAYFLSAALFLCSCASGESLEASTSDSSTTTEIATTSESQTLEAAYYPVYSEFENAQYPTKITIRNNDEIYEHTFSYNNMGLISQRSTTKSSPNASYQSGEYYSYEYDNHGNITAVYESFDGENYVPKQKLSYNSDDKHTEILDYSNGKLSLYTTYEYNENEITITAYRVVNSSTTFSYKTTYVCDDEGNIIKKIDYEETGDILKEEYYDEEGLLSKTIEYTYDYDKAPAGDTKLTLSQVSTKDYYKGEDILLRIQVKTNESSEASSSMDIFNTVRQTNYDDGRIDEISVTNFSTRERVFYKKYIYDDNASEGPTETAIEYSQYYYNSEQVMQVPLHASKTITTYDSEGREIKTIRYTHYDSKTDSFIDSAPVIDTYKYDSDNNIIEHISSAGENRHFSENSEYTNGICTHKIVKNDDSEQIEINYPDRFGHSTFSLLFFELGHGIYNIQFNQTSYDAAGNPFDINTDSSSTSVLIKEKLNELNGYPTHFGDEENYMDIEWERRH